MDSTAPSAGSTAGSGTGPAGVPSSTPPGGLGSPAGSPPSRRKPPPQKQGSLWRELPVLIVVTLGLVFLVRTFLVQTWYIPSSSMEDTLQIGDRVLVNRLVYHLRDIHRGDIVVFDGKDSFSPEITVTEPTNPVARFLQAAASAFGFPPPSERDFIKRVIGVPGDRVACCDAQGRVTVNGVPLDEQAYLYPGDKPSEIPFDVVVPAGKLWVMGDHRSVSADSRVHLGDPGGGFVPEDQVVGRAFVVFWPFGHAKTLPIPPTFTTPALERSAPGAGATTVPTTP